MTVGTAAATDTQQSRRCLQRFVEAWLDSDLSRLGELITDDCVYSVTTGPEPGRSYAGRAAVLEGFSEMLPTPGDGLRFGEVFVDGARGCVEWAYGGEGTSAPYHRGCDVFTLIGGRVARKDAFRKVN